jgi:hypothetical protein
MTDIVCTPAVVGCEAAEKDPTVPVGWIGDQFPIGMIPEGHAHAIDPQVQYDPTCNSSSVT